MLTFWCLFNSGLRAKLLSHLLHWCILSRLGLWVSMWAFRLLLRRMNTPQISHLCPCIPGRRLTPITLQNVFKDTMTTLNVAISGLKVMGYRSGFRSSIDFFYGRIFGTKAFEVLGIKESANHVFYIHADVEQYKNESLFLSCLAVQWPLSSRMQTPFPFYSLSWGAQFCLKTQSTRLQSSKVVLIMYSSSLSDAVIFERINSAPDPLISII